MFSGRAIFYQAKIYFGQEYIFRFLFCPGYDLAGRVNHERAAVEFHYLFFAHPVGQGAEITVLESGHLELGLEQPGRPLSLGSGLGFSAGFIRARWAR